MAHIVIVGAGIVGLATGARLAGRGDRVTMLDKEAGPAHHQTGHNSGVVHSGLYYAPGSLKARMCLSGARSMVDFAQTHAVAVRVRGKLVVANDDHELARLESLYQRGIANGVRLRQISPAEAREHEPALSCVGALHVESTAVIDFPGVCTVLENQIRAAGGEIRYNTPFLSATQAGSEVVVQAGGAALRADLLLTCAGLQADRVARASGIRPSARIVPFRGEYMTLREPTHVRGLIYPTPDPRLPFLGVHITRGVDEIVHAGPNAVLSWGRERYRGGIKAADAASSLTWQGTWRMAAHHSRTAIQELYRSRSRRRFAQDIGRMLPHVRETDLTPAPAGIRAQAVLRDGTLVDDFLMAAGRRQIHVLNAPSPAATAALEIATRLVALADEQLAT